MQVNRNLDPDSYTIHSYSAEGITITLPFNPAAPATGDDGAPRREVLRQSLVIMPDRLISDWPPQRFEELEQAHFDLLAAYAPEVVLFGSGARLQRPHPALLSGLTDRGIGVEVMDTGSACRTYNFLMSDRRRVVAALLMITPP
ncbi:MAG: Mth938-like domain-containing protein [Gammaproteobacteria bacterium]|nr:Mth938-like domain-containing protein [Gammaproteobacteria bacterium]